MAKIIVLGAGAFGISMALTAFNNSHCVTLWSALPDEIAAIRRDGEHKIKLPGVKIPEGIALSDDISEVANNDIVIFGIPTQFLRATVKNAAPFIKPTAIIVNTGKGFEDCGIKRLSEVIAEEVPNVPVVVLTGPSHAEEVSMGIPTAVTVASADKKAAAHIQDLLCGETFRIYVNDDVIGCELGGALKNIIAIGTGICDGLKYGDNTKAALITRGISEVAGLGVAMGAQATTFAGLTGIGDMIVTCTSMHSRNRRAGILIGQGLTPEEAVKQVGTVEGYCCCKAAVELSKKYNAAMPITAEVHRILFENAPPREAITNLMGRPNKSESV
jgi:glycerol-3-phosphate dehydrogenase (NAD(P)+)